MQSLIQCLERERASPLCLCPRTSWCRAAVSTVLIPAGATAGPTPSCGRHLGLGEGRTQSHCHQDVENLVRHSCDERFCGTREELGKGKGLGGVAAERVGGLAGVEVGEDGLVEAEIGPACDQAKDG